MPNAIALATTRRPPAITSQHPSPSLGCLTPHVVMTMFAMDEIGALKGGDSPFHSHPPRPRSLTLHTRLPLPPPLPFLSPSLPHTFSLLSPPLRSPPPTLTHTSHRPLTFNSKRSSSIPKRESSRLRQNLKAGVATLCNLDMLAFYSLYHISSPGDFFTSLPALSLSPGRAAKGSGGRTMAPGNEMI